MPLFLSESYIAIIFYLSLFKFIKKVSYKFIKLSWLCIFNSFKIFLLLLIFLSIFIARNSDIMPLPYEIEPYFTFTMIFNLFLPTTVSKMRVCPFLVATPKTQILLCLNYFLPKPFITGEATSNHSLSLARIYFGIRCIFSLQINCAIQSIFLIHFLTLLI